MVVGMLGAGGLDVSAGSIFAFSMNLPNDSGHQVLLLSVAGTLADSFVPGGGFLLAYVA